MRFSILILFLLAICTRFMGQPVQSSCVDPDTLSLLYQEDADRITARWVNSTGSNYQDSARLPQVLVDRFLDAFIALHNANGMPARDTVLNILNIHTLSDPSLNEFSLWVGEATQTIWMQQFNQGNPIGIGIVDSLINEFGINFSYGTSGIIRCTTFENFNLPPILNAFSNVPEVWQVDANLIVGSGPDISLDSVNASFVLLKYKYGWPWCGLTSCPYNRYWDFKVYADCSIEYLGSYGDVLSWTGIEENSIGQINSFPNPFTSKLFVNSTAPNAKYFIHNSIGTVAHQGNLQDGIIEKLDGLAQGHYVLLIEDNGRLLRKTVMKQ